MEVQKLLEKGAVERVSDFPGQFLSHIFLRDKKDGSKRPVFNLRQLNQWIEYSHFKMEGMIAVTETIMQGDWMIKIDLRDAYFCVAIAPEHRKFLRFRWEGSLFQFNSLPFGLASGPRLYTKLLKPVVSFLRRLGFRLVIYLDDLILMNQHAETLIMERNTCLWLLTHLGMLINWEKSILEPCQNLDYLGFVVDSLRLTLSLPPEKVAKIKKACQNLLKKDTVVVRDLAKLIGQMTASLLAVLPAPLHYRHLQMLRTKGLLKNQNYEACVQLDQTCRNELRWWLHHLELWNGKTFITPCPDMTIQSDSSKVAWGAVCGSVKTQGMWSAKESALHINVLELQAANFAVQSFTKDKNNIHVHLQLDNTTAVAYLNKMGGTRSKQLEHVTQDIFQYALSRQITITAEHLPGVQNVEADYESRVCQDWSNWQLQPKMFQLLNRKWGTFVVDLFADRLNAQIPIFYSWKPEQQQSMRFNSHGQRYGGMRFPHLH